MENGNSIIDQSFLNRIHKVSAGDDDRYKKIGIGFNPFPKSGAANINSSDFYTSHLEPFNNDVKEKIFDYISNAFSKNKINEKDTFISAVITGDYGYGKTQLLMYVKYLLGLIYQDAKIERKPYVIYIDNPGVKLSELIGSIISRIGEESFRKYIWNKLIHKIGTTDNLKQKLQKYLSQSSGAFFNDNSDPYDPANTVSYKKFIDSWHNRIVTPRMRKDFDIDFKFVLTETLQLEFSNSALAEYFYELITDDIGINKTWEALSSGNVKMLEKKEALIIREVVRLIKEQGYSEFFILVDEFEDLTRGRLTKIQFDNYLYNLRTLLDEHREWCLLFAMTGDALAAIRRLSPPLADRIGSYVINLTKLQQNEIENLTINYLNLSRPKSDLLDPFTKEAIEYINEKVDGSARRYLKNCYHLIEKAASLPDDKLKIDKKFVESNINLDFE